MRRFEIPETRKTPPIYLCYIHENLGRDTYIFIYSELRV